MKDQESSPTALPSTMQLKVPPNWKSPDKSRSDVPTESTTNSKDINSTITAVRAPQTLHANPTSEISSNMSLSDWRGSLSLFQGFTGTRPVEELNDATWEEICRKLGMPNPAILSNKKQGIYVIPCLLKEAPLVGNTLDIAKLKGKPTIGKMRSKEHVTLAYFLVIDIDGLSEDTLTNCLAMLKADGITSLAYTTHSYGSPYKPGMCVRLIIPADRPLTSEEYTLAQHGFDQKYFGGKILKADPSSAKMYQQQGVWCCHPSRIQHAQSWRHDAGIVSVDVLIQLGRTVQPPISTKVIAVCDDTSTSTFPVSKIIKLLAPINPDLPYFEWLRILMAVFYATNGSYEGFEVVDAWSSGGKKYSCSREIEKKWQSFDPAHPKPVKIGSLIYMAKEEGADIAAIMQDDAFEVIESEEGSDESDLAAVTESSQPPELEPLAAMQKMFGLLSISGKMCIFKRDALQTDQGIARKLFLSSRYDGALLIERAIRAAYPEADASDLAKEFFVNPDTVCYHGIEFNPKGTSKNYLNLWEGPTIKTMEGRWLLIQEFLHDVVCNGDFDSYLYLTFFIAHALQRPEEKPGVMIILIGGQGVGKGTLGRILQKIWSATYIQVNNIDAVVGTFNAILERAYIVFLDEALFAGNRRGTDELKSIVTEPIIQISEKYQPSRQIRSVHRFIAATNADHFKNTERDDRRDFTLRVSESRKGDHSYWKTLNEEIEFGGVEAMVHDMLAMDLSNFNVRNKPNTKELIEQKLHSLDPIQRWWHDGLYNRAISNNDTWPEFISTADAIVGIIEVNGGRMHKKPSAITISQALHKLCPSAKQHQQQSQYSRHRGYRLPPLQQAREEFEQYIGGVVEWPDLESSEESTAHAPLGDSSALRSPDF